MAQRLPLDILIVEDNAISRKLLLRILSKLGYDATSASNGAEALHALERNDYDVILMDLQMPEVDGLEAARRINQRWSSGHRPHIVALTANSTRADQEACLAAGMDGYISKPIRIDELIAELENIGHSIKSRKALE